MKTLFVYTRTEKEIEASGEAKKIKMQVAAISNNGVDSDILYHDRYIPNNRILIRLPFYHIYGTGFKSQLFNKLQEGYEAIYIRKYIFDKSFIVLLKEIKNNFRGIKIIVEIPTYPYDLEWKDFVDWPLLIKEKQNRNRLYKYVDRFVTFSNDDFIFNVTCIKTRNGIDCSKIRVRKPQNQGEIIHLLGVACIESWHGFDRLIRGLYKYYKDNCDRKLVFDIVGEGAEVPHLKKIVNDFDLNDYVIFHGSKYGCELDELFDKSDIGVGSLGMYRIGLMDGSTLKLREYMARGIPFIYAYNDSLIESNDIPYKLKFSNDDTDIDIKEIIKFYNRIYKEDINCVANKMAAYANEYLTWDKQMQPIADYIKSNNCKLSE